MVLPTGGTAFQLNRCGAAKYALRMQKAVGHRCPTALARVRLLRLETQAKHEVHQGLARERSAGLVGCDLTEQLRVLVVELAAGGVESIVMKRILEVQAEL